MHSFYCCSLPVWRISLENGTNIYLLWPDLEYLPLGGFGQVNTNVRGHQYFILTKFGEYPSSDSVVKADYV